MANQTKLHKIVTISSPSSRLTVLACRFTPISPNSPEIKPKWSCKLPAAATLHNAPLNRHLIDQLRRRYSAVWLKVSIGRCRNRHHYTCLPTFDEFKTSLCCALAESPMKSMWAFPPRLNFVRSETPSTKETATLFFLLLRLMAG